jgi:general secretion pathway protein H
MRSSFPRKRESSGVKANDTGSLLSQGRPIAKRSAGFTLIEILVVVLILAIAAGVAVATIGNDERGVVRREAQRFGGALEYAARRAQWRNETLGVNAAGREIRFWRRNDDGTTWTLVRDDDVIAPRTVPESIEVTAVTYAGRRLAPNVIVPLRPSGRNEPSTFALTASANEVDVALDPLNRVTISPHAIAP